MSALKILSIASLLCLTLGDPIPNYTDPSSTSNVQAQVEALIVDIQNLIDTQVRPLIANLSIDDQDDLIASAVQGVEEYINYLLFLANTTNAGADSAVILTMASSGGNYFIANPGSTTAVGNK